MSKFGRLPFKPDDRDWPVARLKRMIDQGVAVPLDWSVPRILDQGDNGTCVSAGILGACDCDDEFHAMSKFTNDSIIPFFKTIDGWGPLPDGGAQVRDGLKSAQKLGYIKAYAPLTSKAAIIDWLENHGPVVFGMDWLSGMETPSADGFVSVSGAFEGGHCVYGNGDLHGFDLVNSWAVVWGDKGHFYMTPTNFDRTMNGDFEAWAIVQAPDSPAPTPPPPTPVEDKDLLRYVLHEIRLAVADLQKAIDHILGKL